MFHGIMIMSVTYFARLFCCWVALLLLQNLRSYQVSGAVEYLMIIVDGSRLLFALEGVGILSF
jgi:hypothetical protein